jgi:hypothetical protein
VYGKAWQLPPQRLRLQEDEHAIKGERVNVHVNGWRCVTAVAHSLQAQSGGGERSLTAALVSVSKRELN